MNFKKKQISSLVCVAFAATFSVASAQTVRVTASGEEAFLEAVVSPVFREFIDLADKHPLISGMDDWKGPSIVQAAFSVACDPGAGGESFHIELGPKCTECSSHDMKTWRPVEPPKSSMIAAVSHVKWSNLNVEERRALIDKTIKNCIESAG